MVRFMKALGAVTGGIQTNWWPGQIPAFSAEAKYVSKTDGVCGLWRREDSPTAITHGGASHVFVLERAFVLMNCGHKTTIVVAHTVLLMVHCILLC